MNILTKKESEFIGSFPNFELDNLDFTTVLLQTGYLTIKNEKSRSIEPSIYTNHSAESVEPMTKNMLKYIYT
ncbi:MAG: hypothetical protein LBB45_00965 [Methanobrevibacter sp.]|jgi:hypothetical protein|nr:hypothetical protein [Candidatus Methanovirga basalitermitum]